MEVKGMVAHAPSHRALLTGGAGLVGLALDAQVHDVVPATKEGECLIVMPAKEPRRTPGIAITQCRNFFT
jgi:hypothetical protein